MENDRQSAPNAFRSDRDPGARSSAGRCRCGPALVWTSFVLATLVLPTLIPVIAAIPSRRAGVAMSGHLRALGWRSASCRDNVSADIAFLADQACLMSDAIGRTLWRLFVSRKHLLEWTPAAKTSAGRFPDLRGFSGIMSGAFVVAAATLAAALLSRQRRLAAGGAFRRALARLTGARALCQPSARRRGSREAIRCGGADPQANRAPNVAVLRGLRHR